MLNLAGLGLQFRPLLTASLAQQAMAIMQKYNASAWLPAAGTNAEYNTSDSLGTTPAALSNTVGFVGDYVKEFAPENLVLNSEFVGVNIPNNAITEFVLQSSAEVLANVVNQGTDSNGNYVDILFKGTRNAASFASLRFFNVFPTVVPGDLYTVEADIEVLRPDVSGSQILLQVLGLTAASAFVEGSAATILQTPGRRRYVISRVLSNAASVRLNANIQANGTANIPVDALIRIWKPQVIRGVGGVYVPTTGVARPRTGYSSLNQETAGFRPTLTSNQLWTFDGVDDRLVSSSPPITGNASHFIVCGHQTPAVAPPSNVEIVGSWDLGSGRSGRVFITATSFNSQASWGDGATNVFITAAGRVASEGVITTAWMDAVNCNIRARGTIAAPSTPVVIARPPTVPVFRTSVGATPAPTGFFTGPIYGVISGDGEPTSGELTILENFLAAHAGITLV